MNSKRAAFAHRSQRATRWERLAFHLDKQTNALVQRAAHLQGRKVTEFCMTALAEAARRTIEQHEGVVLSERDRKVFFDTLMTPPARSQRLKQAFDAARRRVKA